MIQNILLRSVSDLIEEEVEIQVRGLTLTCFAYYCPGEIHEGAHYAVELGVYVDDGLALRLVSADEPSSAVRVDAGFSYDLTGVVRGANLEVDGVYFDIEELLGGLDGLSAYDGSTVCIRVDRIQIAFV
ncbi:hypothetical protein [Stenotrophomonas sp. PS02289]|uniref:hypothetical protein n=1 Tax=Stenotrophomonas sp. PS02289 TaxID=2991422 RepID=UPI00249AF5A8|nr:hypothetical protein [Stenotrophomonas sp. PS02289]